MTSTRPTGPENTNTTRGQFVLPSRTLTFKHQRNHLGWYVTIEHSEEETRENGAHLGVWSPRGGLGIDARVSSYDQPSIAAAAALFWATREDSPSEPAPPTISPEPERLDTESPSGFEVAKTIVL